jgi:hypothetical protein
MEINQHACALALDLVLIAVVIAGAISVYIAIREKT